MDIKLASTAFEEGGMIPKQYTCEGADVSPPLSWNGLPEKTHSLALICDDPDTPSGAFTHWVIYNLPPSTRELPMNIPKSRDLASGAKQGTNDFRKIGYNGPCPPSGTHRYYFKLYALDAPVALQSGATKAQLLKAMEGHIISSGQLMGKYSR